MEPERLKREFGGRIAFWGGIDSQHLLPHGTPEQVLPRVRRPLQLSSREVEMTARTTPFARLQVAAPSGEKPNK